MKLLRDDHAPTGIFGRLVSEDMKLGLYTLEHAFPVTTQNPIIYVPIIPPGEYLCVLGLHQLKGMTTQFQTYEITDVAGHSKLLFHWGNFNSDSEGCVLLGLQRQGVLDVLNSKTAFKQFMTYLNGAPSFSLTVT